jgi:Fic family protein
MGSLELFLREGRTELPLLIKAGLVHAQFETIHPFLDGNGRLGRLLITFLLCAQEEIREPILYLSLYFKTHRAAYYEHLDRVRVKGDWEAWLDFFLTGVKETADQAASAARRIVALFEEHQEQIEKLPPRGVRSARLPTHATQSNRFHPGCGTKDRDLSSHRCEIVGAHEAVRHSA